MARTNDEKMMGNRKPVYGFVELENGIVMRWLRFATSDAEAVRVVVAQHVTVSRCWVES